MTKEQTFTWFQEHGFEGSIDTAMKRNGVSVYFFWQNVNIVISGILISIDYKDLDTYFGELVSTGNTKLRIK
jgi:hypothetical protein